MVAVKSKKAEVRVINDIENLIYMYELDLNIYLEYRHIGDGENIKSKNIAESWR